MVYDPDQDAAENEDLWLNVVQHKSHWRAISAAEVTWSAYLVLNLYPRLPWLGVIMAASLLRERGV